jgi:STE24 endopeptidase
MGRRLGAGPASVVTDPRALALLMAIATVAGLASAPLQSLVTRRAEARADVHALALTGDPGTIEAVWQQMVANNLADADPPRLEYVMFASHPSIVERIAIARAYGRGVR